MTFPFFCLSGFINNSATRVCAHVCGFYQSDIASPRHTGARVYCMCMCEVITALKPPGSVKGALSGGGEGADLVAMMTTIQPLSSFLTLRSLYPFLSHSSSFFLSLPLSAKLSRLLSLSLSHSQAVTHPSCCTLNWK